MNNIITFLIGMSTILICPTDCLGQDRTDVSVDTVSYEPPEAINRQQAIDFCNKLNIKEPAWKILKITDQKFFYLYKDIILAVTDLNITPDRFFLARTKLKYDGIIQRQNLYDSSIIKNFNDKSLLVVRF